MRFFSILLLTSLMLSCKSPQSQPGATRSAGQLIQDFKNPPLKLKSRPLWFWNAPLSREQTLKVMEKSREAGYYGMGILPSYGMSPDFMTAEFLDHYRYAVEVADSLGMKLYLYDEFYFPSGMAGGKLFQQYPESVSKRLDMELFEVKGFQPFNLPIPEGAYMGAVGMENGTNERIDLTDNIHGGELTGELPAGDWTVMIFTVNPDGSTGRNHVDYLCPEAVGRFIELTYEKYYQAFPGHFGTTIDYAFYDEPCLRWVEGARTWTGGFNTKFKAMHGFSPVILYPALWFDIGPDTEAARNLLLGFRAELYATGFPKVINDWCREHRIELTGHVDQEEIVNPVAICGDLMKAFKYQDIPAVDQIFFYGRASRIYKVISSAANNYDRPIVATECYGAMGRFSENILYKEAMDQFAKGINLMEPHAAWYAEKVDIQPDLSPASVKFGAAIPAFNEYIGRLQGMLQGGQHIADIGILYPIASLQGSYHFGPGDHGGGGVIPAEADYLDIGEMLSLEIRRDFTYIHPEVLNEKCEVRGSRMLMNNAVNQEEFSLMIIPGSKTIQISNLQKIKTFYDQGGLVVATSALPDHSAEIGMDEEVQSIIKEVFGENAYAPPGLVRVTSSGNWNTGGFLPSFAIDSRPETSWRPSQGTLKGEYLEIGFGGTQTVSQVKVAGEAGMDMAFRVMYLKEDEWVEAGSWQGSGPDKPVRFDPVNTRAIRILLESGEQDKVSIPEVEILDDQNRSILHDLKQYTLQTNRRGGKAWFIPAPGPEILKRVLDETGHAWDLLFEEEPIVSGGNISYLHKRINGLEIYFFANSSGNRIDVPVALKGKMKLQSWDPHTGRISECPARGENLNGTRYTRAQLQLEPEKSVFWIHPTP